MTRREVIIAAIAAVAIIVVGAVWGGGWDDTQLRGPLPTPTTNLDYVQD